MKKGGLPGPVGSDQRQRFARPDRKMVYVKQRSRIPIDHHVVEAKN
jgi:hypothetical protein